MDYDKLTKSELIRRLKALERATPDEAKRLLQDLQVHQIELEAQNEELREAQAELEHSRDRYADLYDFAPIGYVTFDDRGTIVQINLPGAAMLGMERAHVAGRSFQSFLNGPQVSAFCDYLKRVYSTTERLRHTASLTRPDGGIVNVRMESVLAHYDSQVRCFSAMIDISEQLRLEARLREQAQRLVELDRRKDEFLAILAHELRNPLAPIHNAVHLLRIRGTVDVSTLQWALDLIGRQVTHLARLVDDLLDVERLVHGKIRFQKQPIDIVRLVNRVVDANARNGAPLQERLSALVPTESLLVYADEVRLTQIIENLLANAARSTEAGGTIQIKIECDGPEVKLQLSDTGVGIARESLPHIFEPFVQGNAAQGGLGLGLTLVQKLVHEHDGRITAESGGKGQGSTFTVRLPLFREPSSSAIGRGRLAPREISAARRVMVVEDNRDVAETLAALLGGMGHTVMTAYDGESALTMARTFEPEIALIDLALPGIDGFAVASQLRAARNGQPLKLVAFTGYGGKEVVSRAHTAGFDAHLVKPGSPDALAAIFAEC